MFIIDRFLLSICLGVGAPHIVFFWVLIGANYFLSVVTPFDRLSDHPSTGSVGKKDSPLKRLSGGCRPLRGGMPESWGAEVGSSGGYVCSIEVPRREYAFWCVLQLRFRMAKCYGGELHIYLVKVVRRSVMMIFPYSCLWMRSSRRVMWGVVVVGKSCFA